MKNILLLTCFVVATLALNAQSVTVSASEPDAKIIVDGQNLGTGTLKIKVPKGECVNVKIQKVGFLKYEQIYCNKKGGTPPPKQQYFELKRDDAEEASIKTDQANVDFSVEVNKKYDVSETWKLTTQIVTDYFDAIEVSDKETSYLRTAWSVQSFQQNTIRTRLIIKLGDSNPLTFKVKLVSEYSGTSGSSVKADEQFREWDRILRKYQNIISDFSTRLGMK
ncbi:MAG: hypothetical protein M0Q26_01010 [Chitinophagaceae bacterium]|nr:hypothetical protein [Chitinophagaceae bacterium]MDP1765136.1 hypothetical protein [Sediminibacterium sp.]MDP1810504.1 hypothetical protein [Sediminibacterium sp.]MDP3129575.1 hypothetical protein [Sediminibacterium sp.]MDP3666061.1 hypothetical protein [Sediminibacterium sp.]